MTALQRHIVGRRPPTDQDPSINTFGTVFGVYKTGGWCFYLQENATVMGGGVKGALYFPLCLTQIFPRTRQLMINTTPPKHELGLL